ncbi:DegT/DnrJ/EryC1/StrS family aminotransferase [Peptoniphilaceae bacterium SGI.137]|nr:DegT/DnrJ/EryC1/StrS aminotransferase family protein [Peptoniphilaceae bacterium]MDY3986744.1 DegT/DnrJ/EryC1/StrS aminotransferase family protein [Peptoniphilaceae bacterium]MDY6147025.1 DegT/DnrJ/EryC1/StrS aminotransferase family protein [Peptoniphilaceae bacterium]
MTKNNTENPKKEMRSIPFSPPDIREEDIEMVVEALRSGWITTGPRTKEFEKELTAYLGSAGTVCLNSATAALELSLRIMGIGPGDEVIVTAYTYTASASVIEHVGAKIVMVDVQPDTVLMDPDAVEAAITERTKAIIPVDVGGVIVEYDDLYRRLEAHRDLYRPRTERQRKLGRIAVIADCAHSLGATKNGVHAGAIGDFSCFSFHAVKNLTTSEGGALSWRKELPFDSAELYKAVQLLSLHGQNKDALKKNQLGAWEYDILIPGYKCNMTDICAALGLSQFKRYAEIMERRHAIIRRYNKSVVDACGCWAISQEGENFYGSGHLYLARLPHANAEQRNAFIAKMGEKGVACNVHYKPLPMMTAYRNMGFSIENFSNAYAFYENEITLPLHTVLTDEDVEYVCNAFEATFQELFRA